MILTLCRLRELLDYDRLTGLFVWLIDVPYTHIDAGSIAGHLDKKSGYIRISIDGKRYQAHQLAWFYVTGEWVRLDHKNLKKSDNWLDNLRPATRSQNAHNKARFSTNTSGFKGVCFHRRKKLWQASITKDYKQRCLGYFDRPEDAYAAYVKAAGEIFGEFARG